MSEIAARTGSGDGNRSCFVETDDLVATSNHVSKYDGIINVSSAFPNADR